MKKRQLPIIFIIVSLLLVVTACGGDSGDSDGNAAGEELFKTAGDIPCSTCHTLDGSTLVGPSMQGLGERAAEEIPGMSAEDYIHEAIVDPSAHVVEGYPDSMPQDYGEKLSEEELNTLVEFLLSQ